MARERGRSRKLWFWIAFCVGPLDRVYFVELKNAPPYKRFVEIGEGTYTVMLEKNRMQFFREIMGVILGRSRAACATVKVSYPQIPPKSLLHAHEMNEYVKCSGIVCSMNRSGIERF